MGSPNRLTTRQASEWLGLPEATLRWYRHRGDRGPRSYQLGSRIFYDLGDLEQWEQEQKAQTARGWSAVTSQRVTPTAAKASAQLNVLPSHATPSSVESR
jgi:hypothetical protein